MYYKVNIKLMKLQGNDQKEISKYRTTLSINNIEHVQQTLAFVLY